VVTRALGNAATLGPMRWQGVIGDGGSCLVVQSGIGPVRAAEEVGLVATRLVVSCGCAAGLAPWLRAGDLVIADRVVVLDRNGRPSATHPALGEALAAWALRAGFRAHLGTVVATPVVLQTGDAKVAAAGSGALAADMESGALAGAALARGIPFAAVRVVVDEAADDLSWAGDAVDGDTGEIRVGAALGALAGRPRLWPSALRMGRRQQRAARRLRAFMAAAFAAGRAPFFADVAPATAASH